MHTISHTSEDCPIWLANLKNPHLAKDIGTLGLTINSVLDDIAHNNLEDMDNKLASVNVSEAPCSHLLAVLTSLFTWRHVLNQWPLLRDRFHSYCKEQNIKGTDRAFKGLFD